MARPGSQVPGRRAASHVPGVTLPRLPWTCHMVSTCALPPPHAGTTGRAVGCGGPCRETPELVEPTDFMMACKRSGVRIPIAPLVFPGQEAISRSFGTASRSLDRHLTVAEDVSDWHSASRADSRWQADAGDRG